MCWTTPPWPASSGYTATRPGDLTLFQNQADRWKTGPGLADAQRAGLAAYETLIAQLRQVNSDVLAVAAELSHGTIETVLAKSDLQLGMEAHCAGRPRSGPVLAHPIEGLGFYQTTIRRQLPGAGGTWSRSIARAPAAIACVPAAPGSALDSRSRTKGDLLPAPADVQLDAERPGQQRLQLRDVQDHRPALGRTTSATAGLPR